MTADILAEIERMNKAGLNDAIIAETLYYSPCTIGKARRSLGLPTVGINRTQKRYSVYDGKTTQFIVEGTCRECCARLKMSPTSFRSSATRFRRGEYTKYEIYEVEE